MVGALFMYRGLTAWSNLMRAYRMASKGKRGQANVAACEHHLEDNLVRLREDLIRENYRPGASIDKDIHESR